MSKLVIDIELNSIRRICRELALLPPGGRRRVLAYVNARVESLPVLNAVGGGTEGGGTETDSEFDEVPMLPLRNRGSEDAA